MFVHAYIVSLDPPPQIAVEQQHMEGHTMPGKTECWGWGGVAFGGR